MTDLLRASSEKEKRVSGFMVSPSSSNVRVERLALKGRVLVAQNDLSPGDEIFTSDALITCIPGACVACGDRHCMSYCDKYHRFFKDMRSALNSVEVIASATGTPPLHVRLALKFIALRHAADNKSKLVPSAETLDSLFDLMNVRHRGDDREQDLTTASKIIAVLPDSHKTVLTKDRLSELLGIIVTNAHHISYQGIGFFPVAVMLEHSCLPNAAYEMLGERMTVTAIGKILKGDAIAISYIPMYLPRSARQEKLAKQYHFECMCPLCSVDLFTRDLSRAFKCRKCEDGIVTPTGNGVDPTDWKCEKCDAQPTPEVVQEMTAAETAAALLDLPDVPVDQILSGHIFHSSHYVLYRALDYRVKFLARIRPNLCETWLKILLESAKRVLPEFHPDKAVLYDTLGQVYKLIGDFKQARDAFTGAWQMREKTNGKNAPITLHAKNKRDNPERVDVTLWTSY